ncbi:MAG: AI-2E family transporter [Tatlockia sp.]|nr:AI-2E family transporter [Tatlockia sp.]
MPTSKIAHHYYLLLTILVLLLIGYTVDIFLLAFAGILLAILIKSLSNLIRRYSHVSENVSMALVFISLITAFSIFGFFMAPAISEQASQLYTELPQAWNKLSSDFLTFINVKFSAGTPKEFNLRDILPKSQGVLAKISSIFTSTFGFFGNLLVVLFFGLSLAFQSKLYVRGFVHLFPKDKQVLVSHVLKDITETLKLWLAGKLISMLFIGLITWFGLWLLDIPLAFTLAFIAAILSFIPNIGPILSAIPAILLALLISPISALYVLGLYLAIQTVESYIITPIIQQKSISLPPGLIVLMQLIMSLLTGFLGLALVAPILAVISVLTNNLYLKHLKNRD